MNHSNNKVTCVNLIRIGIPGMTRKIPGAMASAICKRYGITSEQIHDLPVTDAELKTPGFLANMITDLDKNGETSHFLKTQVSQKTIEEVERTKKRFSVLVNFGHNQGWTGEDFNEPLPSKKKNPRNNQASRQGHRGSRRREFAGCH